MQTDAVILSLSLLSDILLTSVSVNATSITLELPNCKTETIGFLFGPLLMLAKYVAVEKSNLHYLF